jgi:hypothetical protein
MLRHVFAKGEVNADHSLELTLSVPVNPPPVRLDPVKEEAEDEDNA